MTVQKRRYSGAPSAHQVVQRSKLGDFSAPSRLVLSSDTAHISPPALAAACTLPLVSVVLLHSFLAAIPLKKRRVCCRGLPIPFRNAHHCAGQKVLTALGKPNHGLVVFKPECVPSLSSHELCLLCHDAMAQRVLCTAMMTQSKVDPRHLEFRYSNSHAPSDRRFPIEWLDKIGISGGFRLHSTDQWRIGVDTDTGRPCLNRH
jgi:hypothetical protein